MFGLLFIRSENKPTEVSVPAPEAAVPAVEETKPVENKEQEEAAPEEEKMVVPSWREHDS